MSLTGKPPTKFFITGGAGFIGSHLVDKLIHQGTVTVYDNLSSGKKSFIENHLGKRNFNFVPGDLLDFENLKFHLKGHNFVFHLAANPDARLGIADTSLDLRLETLSTYNVLEAMRIQNIKSIVFASSGTIYGETPFIPIPEDYGPALPISLYGAGKLASEGLISAFCSTFGMQSWIFRFANIVGKRTTHGVIFDFINKLARDTSCLEILGDGTQSKPYLHVDDCIDGILYCLDHSNDFVNVFNLGCATTTDVTTIAKLVIKEIGLTGVKLKYTGGDRGWPGDIPLVRYNVSKVNKLGWKARYTSNQAVRTAIKDIVKAGPR